MIHELYNEFLYMNPLKAITIIAFVSGFYWTGLSLLRSPPKPVQSNYLEACIYENDLEAWIYNKSWNKIFWSFGTVLRVIVIFIFLALLLQQSWQGLTRINSWPEFGLYGTPYFLTLFCLQNVITEQIQKLRRKPDKNVDPLDLIWWTVTKAVFVVWIAIFVIRLYCISNEAR